MSGRKSKARVLQILAGSDLREIQSQLAALDVRETLPALFSAICSTDEHVHWHGVACMGPAVARLAGQNMEEARIVMRRLLWSLNDESGGIGWGAPEAMTEIMVCHEGLAEEYIHMLISYMREDGEELFQDGNYLELEPLQRGLLWGVARLAETRPEMLLERGVVNDLLPYLQSPDAAVRGLAARALGLLGADEAVEKLQPLLEDDGMFRFFQSGAVYALRVGDAAAGAIESIVVREAG